MQLNTRLSKRGAIGTTLVEAAICTSMMATLVSTLAPSFLKAQERRRVEAVAAQLETDIQWARSLAVARGASVRVSFEATNEAGCYVVHTGPANACRCGDSGPAVCTGTAEAIQVYRLPDNRGIRLESNSRSMLFDAHRGTVTPTGTVKVIGSEAAIHTVVNVMGRVRNCSPAGRMPGYRPC